MLIREFRARTLGHLRATLPIICCVLPAVAGDAHGAAFDQVSKVVPQDVSANDHFGSAIGVGDGVALFGVAFDDDRGSASGSVYVYDLNTGQQLRKLIPNDASSGDGFGGTLAVDGGIVLASSKGDDDQGYNSGSAYLFDIHTGQQLRKLLPDDGVDEDFFGHSVALGGGVALVGAWDSFNDFGDGTGAAYLFDVSTGQQIRKLVPQDGDLYQGLGSSVAISNGVAIVGTRGAEDWAGSSTNRVGSVYLFDITTGDQIGKLIPDDDVTGAGFGQSVVVSGNTVLVSAVTFDAGTGLSSRGSVYVFDLTTGAQIAKLWSDDDTGSDAFGFGIATNGSLAAVGAQRDDQGGGSAGAVYIFDVLTGAQVAKLVPEEAEPNDRFGGGGVAFGEGVFLAGAPFDDERFKSSTGSAYLFEIPEPSSLVLLCLSSVALAGRQRN